MDIQTREANIDIMSVNIKTLHVNRKMMTLSVFRQLPVSNIYTEDGNIVNCDMWGRIKYPIKNEGERWLVTSSNGKLFRCDIDKTPVKSSIKQVEDQITHLQSDIIDFLHDKKNIEKYNEDWKKDPVHTKSPIQVFRNGSRALPGFNMKYDDNEKNLLEKYLSESKIDLKIAKNCQISKQEIMKLDQLFIAV